MHPDNAPFTSLNELVRTALLNKKYYGVRVQRHGVWTKAYDIFLALVGSAVVVSLFPQLLGLGVAEAKTFTQWSAFLAAAGGIARPLLGLEETAARIGQQSANYTWLYDETWALTQAVRGAMIMPAEAQTHLKVLQERYLVIQLSDDKNPSRRLIKRCQKEVLQRHPKGSLWRPHPN